jgi:hypothetical protein
MSGHSLGSNVAGHISKHVKLARVVMLAGPGDTLDSDPQHGKPYCYQDLTNTKCTRKAKPPGWLTDNNFGSNGGTVWKTSLNKLYSIRGACDDTMLNQSLADNIPFDPHMESTLKSWDALALDTVGAFQQIGGSGSYQSHGLVLGKRDPSALPYKCMAASLCGGGHSSMLGGLSGGGGHCDGAGDLATLRAAWEYVLTDP